MIIDSQIQSLAARTHVQSDGSNIGGFDPSKYGYELIPGLQSLLMWTEGSAKSGEYPAWMWYPASVRPIIKNSTKLRMRGKFTVGGDLTGMNVRETDMLLVFAGYKYNGSLQFNKTSGYFQIADANGSWHDVGAQQPELVADEEHDLAIEYAFDFTQRTISPLVITDNYATVVVPAAQQNVLAQPCNWTPGVYVQLQMGSLPSAQKWTMAVSDLQLEWEV